MPTPDAQEVGELVDLFKQGRYLQVEPLAKQLTERFPAHPFAWRMWAATLKRLGRDAQALQVMQQVAALTPRDAEAHNNLGITFKALNRLDEAQASLRQALALKGDYAEAHYNLGNTLQALGRIAEAQASYRQAVALMPDLAMAHFNLGNTLMDLRQFDSAATSFAQAVQARPEHAPARNNLGLALHKLGRLVEAQASFRACIELKPDYVEAHNSLGALQHAMGDLAAAEASCRRALRGDPNHVDALVGLGNVLQAMDRLDEAQAFYRRAIELAPDCAQAHCNLGAVLHAKGQLDEAERCGRAALRIDPNYADALSNLGALLPALGRLDEAQSCCQQALLLVPDHAGAFNNLGVALQALGRLDEALDSYLESIRLKPERERTHSNLATLHQAAGRHEEAERSCREALRLKPDFADAWSNLGNTLTNLGSMAEAISCYRRALQLKPNFEDAHSNLLFLLNYHPDKSAAQVFEAYREYEQQFGQPHRQGWRAHTNNRDTQRRLKVGYVSPALRQHSSRHFLEPLLAQHDTTVVEVVAYAELNREDAVTQRYKRYIEHWVPTKGMSDDALAQRIRDDGIDILVDVAGHTAANRLQVFARKPAPVSLHWLDFGYTTGLRAIDYYLTDWPTVPAGSEALFSETPWRLDGPGLVYRPDHGMGEVNALPALQRGHITFGTLTRAVRINHHTVRVWAHLLHRVAGSKLVVNSGDYRSSSMQQALTQQFAAHGIGPERLQIGHQSPPWDVLRGIDIGLDCFPHNSGTTLFESLYLGVPFVTLAGRASVGRMGCAILSGVGRPEWVAHSEDDYVTTAAELAADLPRLHALRAGLRSQMQASALMDEADFARRVEAAYQSMFSAWATRQDAA